MIKRVPVLFFSLFLTLSFPFYAEAIDGCQDIYEPVCGGIDHYSSCSSDGICDSYTEEKTYPNECELGRDMSGAIFLYEGSCQGDGITSDQTTGSNTTNRPTVGSPKKIIFGDSLSSDLDTRIERFEVNTKGGEDLSIDWRIDGNLAVISMWANCSEEITLYRPENNTDYGCGVGGKERIIYEYGSSFGRYILQPKKVSKKTTVTFELYVEDPDGQVIDSKKKSKNIEPGINISSSTSAVFSSSDTDDKVEEIVQLAKILDLNIDIDLIRLLVSLDIL